MDAIRKKMHDLKGEIAEFENRAKQLEDETKESIQAADQGDCDIRDLGKKINVLESEFDKTFNSLLAKRGKHVELDKELGKHEEEIDALHRRIHLLEMDTKQQDEKLAATVRNLALNSKNSDSILKQVKKAESKNMNSEVSIEELDKSYKEASKRKEDAEDQLEEALRRLGIMEEELKRTEERANSADQKVLDLEQELRTIGDSMKQLETSEEEALKREEVYKEKISIIANKLKMTINRTEYGDKNIAKLNHRIDEIEDDIVRQKQQTMKISNELDETFEEMLE